MRIICSRTIKAYHDIYPSHDIASQQEATAEQTKFRKRYTSKRTVQDQENDLKRQPLLLYKAEERPSTQPIMQITVKVLPN